LPFSFVEVSNGADDIIYSVLWFWCSNNRFLIIRTCSLCSGRGRCISCGLGTSRGGILATRLLRAVSGHVPLLLAEEASPFCHEPFPFFVAKGVPDVDGIYIHHIWVARGRASPLSVLSKSTLPLTSCSQVSLVSQLRAEGEDGLFGEILAHLVSCCLLPLWHGVWPYVVIHDCIQCSWS
jgi:hypothetical protein